ncbi:hypothetical protein LAZ67_17003050 [Cordylochernes scorpioides]|uniref:Uncharacterized protein n=1 Tax=Cordylochernes scorpioides TaxID=51811 RepID=A0ABY6LIJ8_9ARAC|nr:hypothetical protein LAZ67_17003050 [Cordylochernes scorpioides]
MPVPPECSTRLYAFDRTPGHRFEGSTGTDRETFSANRSACAARCAAETEFPCRSASWGPGGRCRLSRETRATHPGGLVADPEGDYLENLCLPAARLCPTLAFILEAGKEPDGAFERDRQAVRDFQECSRLCTRSLEERGFLCRSFLYDDKALTCALYDEDALGDDRKPLKDSTGDLYRVLCGSSDRVLPLHRERKRERFLASTTQRCDTDSLLNNATVECYRRKRLDMPHQVEVKAYSFQECLDECMRRYGRECQAVEFSSRYQTCRFSSFPDAPTPPNLVDDDAYDYYEFKWFRGGVQSGPMRTSPGSWPAAGGGANAGGQGWWPSNQGGVLWPGTGGAGQGWQNVGGVWSGAANQGQTWSSGATWGGAWPPQPAHKIGWPSPGAGAWPPPPPPPPPPGLPPHPHPHHLKGFPRGPWPPGPPVPDPCKSGGGFGGFRKMGHGTKVRQDFIKNVIRADRIEDCQKSCMESQKFACKSFNYRPFPPDNCELSDQDSRTLQVGNPAHFDHGSQFDYFERDVAGLSCLDVGQTCSPDGMEFILRTPEGFYGRIYTNGFYDSCFYDGNGGTVNVLRISRAHGFPRCGTIQYGDVITNIVVVQFNDYVQTSRDKKYNLTCLFSGPGETVVTSNSLETPAGRQPIPLEHLPAQNILTSNMVLNILYRGVPTNTIAVGDMLTFRLETRGHSPWDFFSDMFATNVIAKDPYTGRQVPLIDSRGCPVDPYVFPELRKTHDGALEADFYAFKIPDSDFLVFQATVKTCRGPCEPVICSDKARHGSYMSWGRRKKRELPANGTAPGNETSEEMEEVHELLQVYLSRADIPAAEGVSARPAPPTVCVAQAGYYGLLAAVVVLLILAGLLGLVACGLVRRAKLEAKAAASLPPASRFEDPSEPIYTDPSLFERSRSLRSLTISALKGGSLYN